MANTQSSNSDLDYADALWKSADALRGQVDVVEDKHVVTAVVREQLGRVKDGE